MTCHSLKSSNSDGCNDDDDNDDGFFVPINTLLSSFNYSLKRHQLECFYGTTIRQISSLTKTFYF